MSRCFPYPPPGYTPPSRASNEALIESIKLQKEGEKAKSERKKEKKEKKRDKKEKKKAKEEKSTKLIKDVHLDHGGAYHPGESLGYVKAEISQKGRKDDIEQLERSSITEEHKQPISSQNPSYSSDSTQNSSKRKRHASTPPNGTLVLGNILRIRLPSQKHMKHDVRDVEQPCSTYGRTDVPAEHKIDTTRTDADKLCSTSTAVDRTVRDLPLRFDHKLALPQSVEQNDVDTHLENVHPDNGSKRYKKMKRAEERHRDLILNWTPLDINILRETIDCGDKDWWMGKRSEVNRPEKNMLGVSKELTCSSSCSSWPRAHYLPDVDIYGLPYTLPF